MVASFRLAVVGAGGGGRFSVPGLGLGGGFVFRDFFHNFWCEASRRGQTSADGPLKKVIHNLSVLIRVETQVMYAWIVAEFPLVLAHAPGGWSNIPSTNEKVKPMNHDKIIEQLANRVIQLESLVATMRANTNQAITGHAAILEGLVNHTKYVPGPGRKLKFPRTPVDVGCKV